jgi:hypothetical protein
MLSHPMPLVFPALAANTTVHVRGIRAVLEVVPAAGRQSGLKGAGPLIVGPGETEHLVRGKAKITHNYLESRRRTTRRPTDIRASSARALVIERRVFTESITAPFNFSQPSTTSLALLVELPFAPSTSAVS